MHGLFSGPREPDWVAVATRWAGHADGNIIFYKLVHCRHFVNDCNAKLTASQLPEHLKSYWKTWQENVNEKNSIKVNEVTYKELINLLNIHTAQNPFLSVPAAQPTPLCMQIASGSRPTTAEQSQRTLEPWHVRILLDHHTAAQSIVQYSFGESGAAAQQSIADRKGKKCALPEDIVDQPHQKLQRRSTRTCPRCKRDNCDGRFNSRPCSK